MEFSNKQILKITFPVMVSLLMEQLIGLTDTAYLGQIGEVELGASALAGVFYLVIYMIGFGFSMGAQVLIARRNGARDFKSIGSIFTQGVLFLLLFAFLLFGLSNHFSPVLLRKMIASDAVYEATLLYLNWRVYGFFFSFVAVMFRALYVGTTNTKILTTNSIIMVLTNIILNYILIFGKLGLPAYGIAGAAIASSIAEAVSMVFFIVYTRKKFNYKKYNLFEFKGLDIKVMQQIFSVSIWIMIQHGIAFLGWFVFFIIMEHQGERPLAVTNIVRSISALLFLFVNAFASTSSSLVSNQIGSGHAETVLGLCWRMVRLCYTFVVPIALLFALFPSLILRVYTDDFDLLNACIPSLWVMLSSYLIAVPAFIYFFSVSGTGNTRMTLLIDLYSITAYVLYALWIGYWMKADVAWCWTTEHVYDLFIITSFLYMWKGNWKAKKI